MINIRKGEEREKDAGKPDKIMPVLFYIQKYIYFGVDGSPTITVYKMASTTQLIRVTSLVVNSGARNLTGIIDMTMYSNQSQQPGSSTKYGINLFSDKFNYINCCNSRGQWRILDFIKGRANFLWPLVFTQKRGNICFPIFFLLPKLIFWAKESHGTGKGVHNRCIQFEP